MIKSLKHNLALRLDSIGFVASTLCAIHCIAMPFVLIFLTMYGMQFIADPLFEIVFISSSIVIGIFTFRHGYFKHHKKLYPFLFFVIGLATVVIGHYFIHDHGHEEFDRSDIIYLMISPVGALMIGIGHYLNRKLSKEKKGKACSC